MIGNSDVCNLHLTLTLLLHLTSTPPNLNSTSLKYFNILLVFVSTFNLSAQTEISGFVFVKGGNNPVQGAHCYFKSMQYKGVVSDELGYFKIKNLENLGDTLVISAIGFKQKEIPTFSLNGSTDTIKVYLNEKSIMLNEITIESDGKQLQQIILDALSKIPENYPNKPHQLSGLYRIISTERDKFTKLEEAVVVIDDYSYKRQPSYIKSTTRHFRESKDFGNIDPMAKKIYDKSHDKIAENMGRASNSLIRSYHNPIRFSFRKNSKFNIKSPYNFEADCHSFELMDISIINSDTVLQIAWAWSPTPTDVKPTGQTYLKINLSDLAITEIKISMRKDNFIIGQFFVRYEKQIDDRYYPKQIQNYKPRFINRDSDDHEYNIHTLYIDSVKIEGYKKIKARDNNDPSDQYGYKKSNSDLEYWNNSSLLEKYPLDSIIKRDLEKEQSLEDQFEEAN